jgi:HD-like signal output (HDOD) protein
MADSDFGNPEAFFKNHGGVPKNPALIRQTLEVLRDPTCAATDLVAVLEKEPAISSKVIKAAIVRLGNHNISRIALSASLAGGAEGPWADFWKHSISVAMLSRHIGRFTGAYSKQEEEELFCMGLLHDLGAMVEMDSGQFARVSQTLQPGNLTLSEAENLVFGFDHGRLGRVVAEQWNFPGDLVDAIACHHQPELSKDFYRKVIVIHLADLISHGFNITNLKSEAAPPTQEAYLLEFNMPVEQLILFGDWLLEQKAEIDAFGNMMS